MANKKDLTDAIANATGKTKKDSRIILEAMLSVMSKSLEKGESVKLLNFGTFKVVHREARVGRNPQNGDKIDIPAKNVVKFKAGKALKEAVDYTDDERPE